VCDRFSPSNGRGFIHVRFSLSASQFAPRNGRDALLLSAMTTGHGAQCSALALAPPANEGAWPQSPRLAVATHAGHVVVYDFEPAAVYRRGHVHGSGVHGLAWIGQYEVRSVPFLVFRI
jgi:hypothetical protein